MGLLGIPTGPHEVQIKDGPVGSLSRGSGWESASTCIQVAGGTQFLQEPNSFCVHRSLVPVSLLAVSWGNV